MMRDTMHELVDHNFADHDVAQHDGIIARYDAIREAARALGHVMVEACPPGREKSQSLAHLEMSVMWAVASIARNQDVLPPDDEDFSN